MTRLKPRGLGGAFGPGLLWAGTAIGISHLVQSTRAGAEGGFTILWVILVALALKYPLFEYGPRYAAATGESLIEGYLRIGRWAVWVYLLITVSTALLIQAAVALFTAFAFAQHALCGLARSGCRRTDHGWCGVTALAGLVLGPVPSFSSQWSQRCFLRCSQSWTDFGEPYRAPITPSDSG